MRAMVLHRLGEKLQFEKVPDPEPSANQILIAIEACGVCRTDLHIVDGELPQPKLPLVPGHEIVGRVVRVGDGVTGFTTGMRVGVPWLGSTCGVCDFCRIDRENLCDNARFTGYTLDGGYAELCVADANYCFPMDDGAAPESLAPLLCAGLIGYRALRLAGNARRIGIYGFGAAAHLIAQVAVFEGRNVYAFTRHGDADAQILARELGCKWASGSDDPPPELLDAAIIFAPVGSVIPLALKAVRKGGTVVCGGIHMSMIPAFEYELLWGERTLCSIANLTRQDAVEFLELAHTIPVVAKTTAFPLHQANDVLDRLRSGNITGAAVLTP
jgi:propanol-preferring alcohol dehydrogenase